MGEIIEILEELNSGSFRIGLSVTGEERIVSIDPDKRELFHLLENKKLMPMACPFLLDAGNKKFVCSVHASQPELCRQYSCYHILVLDSQEKKIGRVIDASRYLSTADGNLRTIWNREIAVITIADENCWEEHVDQMLTRAGYHVIR